MAVRSLLVVLLIMPATGAFAGLFGPSDKDEFAASHAVQSKEYSSRKGAHAPVKAGQCSKCHAAPNDPAKLTQEYKPLCLSCHQARVDDLKKAFVHSALKDMDCSVCHRSHASDQPFLLDSGVNELCAGCHELKSEPIARAHRGVTVFAGACTDCHDPHASASAKLIRGGKVHLPFASGACDKCHEPAGKDGRAARKKTPEDTCFSCHAELRKAGERPGAHVPFAGGECLTCHDPHSSPRPALIRKPLADICFSCHDQGQRDSHPVANHPTSKEGVGDPRRPGKPFDCASCHDPHGSSGAKLLRGDIFTLCGECHKR